MPFGLGWIDFGVTTIIIIVVLGIFYKALKEPVDFVLGWVKNLLIAGIDKISDMGGTSEGTTVIKYG